MPGGRKYSVNWVLCLKKKPLKTLFFAEKLVVGELRVSLVFFLHNMFIANTIKPS